MGILDRKPAALSAADIERVVQRAVEEALAKAHDTPDMPRQPAPQSPRMGALLRSLSPPAPVLERPATPPPTPVARPAPPKPLPVELHFERDGNGMIRAASFTAPDGSRHEIITTRDSEGRFETVAIDDDPIFAWRVRRDAFGRTISLVPIEDAPPLRTVDGQPILPAEINR